MLRCLKYRKPQLWSQNSYSHRHKQWCTQAVLRDCYPKNGEKSGQLQNRYLTNLMFIGPCIVIYFYSKTNEMHQFLKFILFCSSTLHVSDGLSVHHQESKTVHTASGVCQTDSADCLLAGTRCSISFPPASSEQDLFEIYLMLYVQF